jgi:6-carboxyhexanoate--CoA ligase
MVSIRMRASRRIKKKDRAKLSDLHISGAEGIYEPDLIGEAVEGYIRRAMTHPRGKPDRIEIKIERIKTRPKKIRSLPLKTVMSRSTLAAQRHIRYLLFSAGVTETAIKRALKVVYGKRVMRGASLISAGSGRRIEPDRDRGVRASRLGIDRGAVSVLNHELMREGIDSETVREALVLASKVACCEEVVAELCVSDDPDYTTGYVSSRKLGYVRVPHIKKKGDRRGGRVFFVRDDAVRERVISFLEKKTVLVDEVSQCLGVFPIDEIIDNYHI